MNFDKKKNIISFLILLIILILFGTFGYMVIEGYSFINALFMTVITITTVGYGTIRDLSDLGIIFTIFLIMSSFMFVGLIAQNFYKFVADGDFKRSLNVLKIKRKVKNLENHVIVCGYGINGTNATRELLAANEKVIVIDKDIKLIEEAEQRNIDAVFITGDARDESILQEAKVDKAKALISALHSDADNLFVVLTARELNNNLKIISRAIEGSSEKKLKRAGADYVILPDSVGGIKMGKLVFESGVIEFWEHIMTKSGIDVTVTEIDCEELPRKYIGRSLGELNIRKKSGANIIGIKREDGTYIFNPGAEIKIEKQTKLFILGTPEQTDLLRRIIEPK